MHVCVPTGTSVPTSCAGPATTSEITQRRCKEKKENQRLNLVLVHIPHLSISLKHVTCPRRSKFVTLLIKHFNVSESSCQLIAKSKIFCRQQVRVGFPVDKQPIPLLPPSCLPSEPKLCSPLHLLFILSSC